jgi:hypothetical protein
VSRSISCSTAAACSGGKAISSRNDVTNIAHTKNGRRMSVSPGARSCRIVTIMLIELSIDDSTSRNMPSSQAVWPIVAMSESGGYDVQPEAAAPPGRKKPAIMTRPAAR